jgi:hypothetical protein
MNKESITRVLDLGSGTGIVGLGIAALMEESSLLWNESKQPQQQQQDTVIKEQSTIEPKRFVDKVALTDLPEALDLIQENIILYNDTTQRRRQQQRQFDGNSIDDNSVQIEAKELIWGTTTYMEDWFRPWLLQHPNNKKNGNNDTTTNVISLDDNNNQPDVATTANDEQQKQQQIPIIKLLITGADIIYRPSIFVPLLQTLYDIVSYCKSITTTTSMTTTKTTNNISIDIDIILACQSIRSTLNEFCELIISMGIFEIWLEQIISLPTANPKTKHIPLHQSNDYWNYIQNIEPLSSSSLEYTIPLRITQSNFVLIPKGFGIIWILSLRPISE